MQLNSIICGIAQLKQASGGEEGNKARRNIFARTGLYFGATTYDVACEIFAFTL